MKRHKPKGHGIAQGPTQRQLRAGELIRHALVEVMRAEDFNDPILAGVPVTITQVRLSPDLRHAQVYIEPLGGVNADEAVGALNRHARFLRGRLGHVIDMKFTPDLKFHHDVSFAEAERMAQLLDNPRVKADLIAPDLVAPDRDDDEPGHGA